jgi:single-strand DNA-binding protein
MAGSLNKVCLIGNVGRRPELKTTRGGDDYAVFSLATSSSWKNKGGGREERTEWHNVVCFNAGLVKVISQYVSKGDKLYVEGEMRTRKYDKDGQTHFATEVVLPNYTAVLVMLGGKKRDDDEDEAPPKERRSLSEELDDEIPF